jgi:DNA-binding response OmpR family regulator
MVRILVIDDEPSICEALSVGLASRDVEVDTAVEGKRGIRLAGSKSYDVLIVDLFLPDLDGIEVIRRAREHSSGAIPILISAHNTCESLIEAKRHGIRHYFEKPFNMSDIKRIIRSALEERGPQAR